jgi:hypothetical protein
MYPSQTTQTHQVAPVAASPVYFANQYPSQTIQTPQLAPNTPSPAITVDNPVMNRSLSTPVVPSSNNTINKRNLSALTIKSQDVEYEDGRVCNTEAMNKIREAWIYTQLRMRASEFTQYKQVKLYSMRFYQQLITFS